ncbi:MAG TPA: phosphotriesterase, partial [Chryseosolibacter sp.]
MSEAYTRRKFLKSGALVAAAMIAPAKSALAVEKRREVITVTGAVDAMALHNTLTHEHILVDFIGAENINPPRWNREQVIERILPYLEDAKSAGCQTFVDCTPNYLGRDVA